MYEIRLNCMRQLVVHRSRPSAGWESGFDAYAAMYNPTTIVILHSPFYF